MSDIPKEYAEILQQFEPDDDFIEFVRMFLKLTPAEQEYVRKLIKEQLAIIENNE